MCVKPPVGTFTRLSASTVSPPPIIEVQLCRAKDEATSFVPFWNGVCSQSPSGPFHITVPDFSIMLLNFSAVHFPMSRIFISSITSSMGRCAVSAVSEISSATTTSCGIMNLSRFFSHSSMIFRAISTLSFSYSDFPTLNPAAARKVFAKAPPIKK